MITAKGQLKAIKEEREWFAECFMARVVAQPPRENQGILMARGPDKEDECASKRGQKKGRSNVYRLDNTSNKQMHTTHIK